MIPKLIQGYSRIAQDFSSVLWEIDEGPIGQYIDFIRDSMIGEIGGIISSESFHLYNRGDMGTIDPLLQGIYIRYKFQINQSELNPMSE